MCSVPCLYFWKCAEAMCFVKVFKSGSGQLYFPIVSFTLVSRAGISRCSGHFHINAKCFHDSTKRLTFRKEVFKEMAAKFSRFTERVDAILAKQGGKSVNLLLLKKVGGLQKNAAGGVR